MDAVSSTPARSASPQQRLRRTNGTVTRLPETPGFMHTEGQSYDNPPPAYPGPEKQEIDTYLVTMIDGKEQWEEDARIAARKAMAKRNSRSFSSRTSRTKSRRREKFGRTARPGIKVDTNVGRHRGNAPRQLYPQDSFDSSRQEGNVDHPDLVNNTRKYGWFSKRPDRLNKDRSRHEEPEASQNNDFRFKAKTMRPNAAPSNVIHDQSNSILPNGEDDPESVCETASTLKPGRNTWMEVSPYDRPIPIGISIPSDSLSEHSSYRTSRERSESDATLTTPRIVITPAVLKSVWSPDTPDSRPRPPSSVYSRSTFFAADPLGIQHAPPVPALPSHVLAAQKNDVSENFGTYTGVSHARNSTIESALTAFEEDDDVREKDRVRSADTFFEEDETPIIRQRNVEGPNNLSLDTTAVPTPRRSRGWWNVITTPFELSRSNSVWTRRTNENGELTPHVPAIPQRFGLSPGSPISPSTYIWSATEKSPSVRGTRDLRDVPGSTVQYASPVAVASHEASLRNSPFSVSSDREVSMLLENENKHLPTNATHLAQSQSNNHLNVTESRPLDHVNQAALAHDRSITSPVSHATSPSPILGTAKIGTFLVPREIHDSPRQMNESLELRDRQPVVINIQNFDSGRNMSHTTPRSTDTAQHNSPREPNVLHIGQPHFAPPPTYAHDSRGTDQTQYDRSPRNNISERPRKRSANRFLKFGIMEWFTRKKNKNPKRSEENPKRRKSRRCCCILSCCCILLLCLVAIVVPVVVTVTKRHNHEQPTNVPSQWLNLTGFPPIPTGVSTIAQPEAQSEISGCVSPATVWSCALPKEEQGSNAPNKADQPNFRLEIVFQNGTISDPSKTQPAGTKRDLKKLSNPVAAGAFIRSRLLNLRATPSASPAPPSVDDQKFLGNTTDGNAQPFEGEQTPFFITFFDPTKTTSSRLARRSDNPFDNITDIIPAPSVNSDGTAAAATLIPLPESQPLRLYNRGQDDEHYGFYTYYDRSIFLKSITPTNSTFGGVPADTNGGSPFDGATMRCTWAQTRFLVQIWTRSQSTKPLLQGSATPTSSSSASPTASSALANDFTRPGSFPYPVTVTVDRHGGTNSDKMIYCYGMDTSGKIVDDEKTFVLEDRAFGGVAVNPSDGPSKSVPGLGIDGGTGGCECSWTNWLS